MKLNYAIHETQGCMESEWYYELNPKGNGVYQV